METNLTELPCVFRMQTNLFDHKQLTIQFEEDIKHFVLVKAEVGHLVSLLLKEVIWELIDFGSDY